MKPRAHRRAHRRAAPYGLTLALLLVTTLGGMGAAQPAPTSRLLVEARFENPETGTVRGSFVIGGQRVDLAGDTGALELPIGTHAITVHTPGLELLSPETVVVTEAAAQTLTLTVRPRLRIQAPPTVQLTGGRAVVPVSVTTDYPHAFPFTLYAEDQEALTFTSPAAMRGVARSDLIPRLPIAVTVAPDAASLTLVANPGGVRREVAWQAEGARGVHVDADDALRSVRPGTTTTWIVTVRNDEADTVDATIALGVPAGFRGRIEPSEVTLGPGASATVQVDLTADMDATPVRPATLTLDLGRGAPIRATLPIEIRALDAAVTIEPPPVTVPGERRTLHATVRGAPDEALPYELAWEVPDWFVSSEPVLQSGVVPAGAAVDLQLSGTIRFGPATRAQVTLAGTVGSVPVATTDELARAVPKVAWEDEPLRVARDSEALAIAVVDNPSDRALMAVPTLTPVGSVELTTDGIRTWTLPPGVSRHPVAWRATREGTAGIELLLTVGGEAIAPRASFTSSVGASGSGTRTTQLTVPLEARTPLDGWLLGLRVPEGAVLAGKGARWDGVALPGVPLGDGWWAWGLAARDGERRFDVTLEHGEALDPPPVPVVLAVRGEHALPLTRGDDAVIVQAWRAGRIEVAEVGTPSTSTTDTRPAAEQPIRIVEPAADIDVRPEEAVEVVIEVDANLAAAHEIEVALNGTPLPRRLLGFQGNDPVTGALRLAYYALPFQPGENELTVRAGAERSTRRIRVAGRPVRLDVVPIAMLADGITPRVLEVVALDELGIPVGFGHLTVETTAELRGVDASLGTPGTQRLLRDGRARLTFAPTIRTDPVDLHLSFGAVDARFSLPVERVERWLWTMDGSVGVHLGPDGLGASASGRGYLEASGAFGSLELALEGAWRRAGAADEGGWTPGLQEDRPARLAADGFDDASERPLTSADGVAFRYAGHGLRASYLEGTTHVWGSELDVIGSTLEVGVLQDAPVAVEAMVGRVATDRVTRIITPDGTRSYRLDPLPARPAVQVTLLRYDGTVLVDRERLEPGAGFSVDAAQGLLTLAQPLAATGEDGERYELEVTYAPVDAAREALAAAVGIVGRTGGWFAEAGVGQVPVSQSENPDAAVGVVAGGMVGYETEGLQVSIGLERRFWEDEFRARAELDWVHDVGRVQLTGSYGMETHARLEASLQPGGRGVSIDVDARLEDGNRLGGTGRIVVPVGSHVFLVAAHERTETLDVTDLRGRVDLDLGGDRTSMLELGVAYDWREAATFVVAATELDVGPVSARVEHRQAVVGSGATTDLSFSATFLEAEATAEVEFDWAGATHGELRLARTWGEVETDLRFARGEEDEVTTARAGVRVPIELHDAAHLELAAYLDRPLGEGAALATINADLEVRAEAWRLDAGVDVAGTEHATKVVADLAASWTPSARQRLQVQLDLRAGVDPGGSAQLSYFVRGDVGSLLTTHRLTLSADAVLEGDIVAYLDLAPAWDLRPALAYRYLLDDPQGTTLQLGISAQRALGETLRVGVAAYQTWQPSTGAGGFAAGAELGVPLTPSSVLVVGYTHGEGPGLLVGGRPGGFVRLDVFGGSP